MPYSGGSYSLPVTSWNPAVASTTISATDWNTTATDLSTALSTCLLKDGTQTATALIPFAQSIRVGVAGSLLGYVDYAGNTSGTTRLQPAATASGTLTLPAATDTLVGRATTDTLTNKSISGSTNTITNIGNSSLTNSSITIGSTNISLGGIATTISAVTLSGCAISGSTTIPGSGSISSGGSLTIGAGQSITAPTITASTQFIGTTLNSNTTAALALQTNSATQLVVSNTANPVNAWQVSGAPAGSPPSFFANGNDTDVSGYFAVKGAGIYRFVTGGISNNDQLRILHTASTNRYVTVTGSNGSNPAISVNGGELAVGTNAWTFGIANVVSPTSPNRTLTVTIGGSTYYIAAKTTND